MLSLKESITPPATLGVLGGGQLGRMFAQSAQSMGYAVWVLDPDPNSPAGQLANRHICAPYDDAQALKLLADLEQQTQRNQSQTCYIQQLEEALKNARQWRFGRKSEAFQGEQRGLFDEDIEALAGVSRFF